MHPKRGTIVQIGKYYHPVVGGIENNVRQVAHACAEHFVSIAICMQKGRAPRAELDDEKVRVIRLQSYGALWRQEIVEYPTALLNEIRPDLVHFHTPNPLLAFAINAYLKHNPATKLVVSHHADLQRPFPIRTLANAATADMLKRANAIIAYTETFARHSREIRHHANKLHFVPHGVAPPRTLSGPRTGSRSPIRLGFLGRLEKWKGVQIILDMLVIEDNCTLAVAGDGSYQSALETLTAARGLGARVSFLGRIDGRAKDTFFESIDALILPSLNTGESYGQVLLEAQSRGVPVIAADLPTGVREICDFGRAGLLFKPGDARELAKRVNELRNPGVYAILSSVGMRQADTQYSEKTVKTALIEIYSKLLSE